MDKKTALKNEIFRKIGDFIRVAHAPKKFIPGSSPVPYAGRVYDTSEIVSLVDSSLEFWLTAGRFAREFEEKMARFLGVKYCLLTNSGSSANLLALAALTSPLLGSRRLQSGDEVITTACGFPTTLNPILQNRLVPVFIDVDLGTYNASVDALKRSVSKKTRAIFLAHALGNPCRIREISAFARSRGLWLIEDNCDALGSKVGDTYTGAFGHLASLSFYPAHHITTGEGGAVLTSDPLLKKIVLSLRDWGRDCWCEPGRDNTCGRRFKRRFRSLPEGYDHKYVYSHIGYNLKVTDMQAAVGCAQIGKLARFVRARQKNAAFLYGRLRCHEKYFILPEVAKGNKPSWFGFPLLIKEGAPFTRENIVAFLERHKIATRMLFGGNLLRQPAYDGIRCRVSGELINTEMVMRRLFWIGVYPGLTPQMLDYVVRVFDTFIRRHG